MSAILSADDLNDFISPGVACIKPVETLPAALPSLSANETEVILEGHQSHVSTANGNAPAQISLTDCLACSGCVTSAEAVLVSLQRHAEVLSTLDAAPALRIVGSDRAGQFTVEGLENEDAKLFVASVSPQTRANLAAACGSGTSESQAGYMLETLLQGPRGVAQGGRWNNGFTWVVDTNMAREATLVLGAEEVLASPNFGASAPARPVLASSCPGWVCYAEKTHPHALPHLSRVKSPQALTGTILKTMLSRKLDIPPSRIWHLSIMPCFDKKLEASREELTNDAWERDGSTGRGVRDVDCVITSKEVLMLAVSRDIAFLELPKDPPRRTRSTPFPDAMFNEFFFQGRKRRNPPTAAGSSGGLLHHILLSKVAQCPGAVLQSTKGRNADVVEYSILLNDEPIFKAARYYGFRNIQNLVRRLKPPRPSRMPGGRPFGATKKPAGKSSSMEYNYVEVMACPGGCTNGGGQIKVDDPIIVERKGLPERSGPEEQKRWLRVVDEAYFSDDDALSDGEKDSRLCDVVGGISRSYINAILAHWVESTNIELVKMAFTTYREVVSNVGKDNTTDTEKVVQLAGKIGGGW